MLWRLINLRSPLYKLGEASSPCGQSPCSFGVICSNWWTLAGSPKRSFNPFTPANSFLHIAIHSPLFSVSVAAIKLGSFIAIFRHSLAAGSCTSYDGKLLPTVVIFPSTLASFSHGIEPFKNDKELPPLTKSIFSRCEKVAFLSLLFYRCCIS